ncbi:CerR family C-terminal domain-containing protein [Duganella qianjiadongensis]|uniref:CerR family C-terminal domain-containing protein n=1 Tax=Duganella qianjiadongensis TaxID=2692176 RepID=A0ABW9VJB1_9BURK|nr:CerR family C-terminal domain-containing protein [Duganella qianjiadongensis]MYM38618.1 CerR family C-terminal domain-containing protein [Duganella qianjiadongensis]
MNAKALHDDSRKPRSDGEQSRIRLLQAATRLFGNQGYSRTSTREIAQAAGANVAAISYYFGDKAGLYQACFAAMCEPAPDNIAQFDQPHYSLRQSLDGYYRQLLAPLLAGEDAQQLVRLFYREMLEPTGLWEREIRNNIKPEHLALAGVLSRHLGLAQPDDRVHRLAYALVGMAIQLLVGRDIIHTITPHLLGTAEAIAEWLQYLGDYAEALVLAEKNKLQQG